MKFSTAAELEVLDLGRCEYGAATERMLELVDARVAGGPDVLILAEFEPVLTVGRGEDPQNYAAAGLPVHSVSRGGKATFHGPGQLVAYPVIGLEGAARDAHAFLHALEDALIRTVGDFGLEGGRDPRNTGCWVRGHKVASIGIALRKWVSYHGLALNVATDLSWFQRFDPCGLQPEVMTSLAAELGEAPPMSDVKDRLVARLQEVLRGERLES